MTRLRLGVPLALLVVITAGCGNAASEAADEPGFASCVEAAGLALDGRDDWDQARWAGFFSQPGALGCAVDELDDEQRRGAMQEAFGPYWESGDVAEQTEAYETRMAALTGQVAETASENGPEAGADLGVELVRSLEWEEAPDADGAVLVLLVVAEEQEGDLPGLQEYLADTGERGEAGARLAYGTDRITSPEADARAFRERYRELTDSFSAQDLVP